MYIFNQPLQLILGKGQAGALVGQEKLREYQLPSNGRGG
jgi:hypothetical protein